MDRIRLYDVRVQEGRGRRTVRIAALDPAEARAQALARSAEGAEVFSCRRSQYAVTAAQRAARREYLEAQA